MFIDLVHTAIQKQCSNKITYSSNYKIIFHSCSNMTRNCVENNINVIISQYNFFNVSKITKGRGDCH